MMENLIWMLMGGLSMMLIISALRTKDVYLKLAELFGYSAIILLSFYIDNIGALTLFGSVYVFTKYGNDKTLIELIEAFNPTYEIKYFYKKYLTLYLE